LAVPHLISSLQANENNTWQINCVLIQVVDLSEDNFFSLIGDDCATRDDLKLTDNCNPNSAEAVRDLLTAAEANGERVLVRMLSVNDLMSFTNSSACGARASHIYCCSCSVSLKTVMLRDPNGIM